MQRLTNKKILKSIIVFIFSLLGVVVVTTNPFPQENTRQSESQRMLLVTEVIDGDTIKSNSESIRLIGIDTPEKGEVGYQEAKEVLTNLVLGKTVVAKPGKDTYDKYGRTLSYIYSDDIFVNNYMIEQGWAKTLSIAPNTIHQEQFLSSEEKAKAASLGLWKN